ncbi:MAG: hypothetical protein ABI162_07425 [Luteolibacter sp.]
MSDETAPTPDNSPTSTPESAPRARKIPTPRPKKAAKPVAEIADEPVSVQPAHTQEPDFSEADKSGSSENDWPEPDAASTGNQSQSEGAKRKRRRRKGKGQSTSAPQNSGIPAQENLTAPITEALEPAELLPSAPQAPRPPIGQQQPMKGPQPQQHQQPPQRPKIDPELLTKMAWKIYLAEVSEEGVALIGDNDAKDLSRRCFRLAEIFIEEQSRRR